MKVKVNKIQQKCRYFSNLYHEILLYLVKFHYIYLNFVISRIEKSWSKFAQNLNESLQFLVKVFLALNFQF
jgi:hypothetical protein